MEFKAFKLQMQQHFQQFLAGQSSIFLTDVDKDTIWDTYLMSFPEEERQSHNCQCCNAPWVAFNYPRFLQQIHHPYRTNL